MAGGRPRKPANQKILQGTFRKDRNPENEPEPTTVSVNDIRRPSSHLNRYAKRFWKDVVSELVETGVLTVIDWTAFELCCDSYGTYMEAKEAIYHPRDPLTGKRQKRSLSEYLQGKNSQTVPELSVMNKGKEDFLKYANVLGLNPVARNRIDIPGRKPEEIDPMEELLNDQARG